MNIYLAGAVTGNLIAHWKEYMKLYRMSSSRTWLQRRMKENWDKNNMKPFLAAPIINKDLTIHNKHYDNSIDLADVYVLESYHYIFNQDWMFPLFKQFKSFLLDSGAFTFMTSQKDKKVDWQQYVINYGRFVRQHDIELFFELDIDQIVGIQEVERLRNILETEAGRKCIPVWHKSRGLDYWHKMVKNYDYVAIGGIVTQEIKRSQYDVFLPLLKTARQNNCKVHGLGFTNLKGMEKYKFYSVDSTSWLSGNKFGAIYLFDGKTMTKQSKKPGQRVLTGQVAIHNFKEWVKFSKYAEKFL